MFPDPILQPLDIFLIGIQSQPGAPPQDIFCTTNPLILE